MCMMDVCMVKKVSVIRTYLIVVYKLFSGINVSNRGREHAPSGAKKQIKRTKNPSQTICPRTSWPLGVIQQRQWQVEVCQS